MKKLEIIPLKYAESVLAEKEIFQGGADDKFAPILFMIYLIKTEDKLILVDAGCETMPGFVMTDFIGPVRALEKHGLKPQDITELVITHAHHDHIECVGKFTNAEIFIQRDEYEAGKGYFKPEMRVNLFEDETTVCDGVKAVKIGGHTKGSCIVEVYDGEKKNIIAGDECYSHRCFERMIPTGASFCREKSMEFLKKYGRGEYTVLLCHEK